MTFLDLNAEESFRTGMDRLQAGRIAEARVSFQAAIDIERQGSGETQPRYLSYYGLSVCLSGGDLHEALDACRAAVRSDPFRTDFWWNHGRVARIAGRRAEAYRALRRGLSLHPGHAGLRRELGRMGIRRRPVIRFLPRANPLNVFLGRMARSVPRWFEDGARAGAP